MKYLLSSLIVWGLLVADAEALGPGDVAIIGVRADDIDGTGVNGNDEGVAWVPLVNLAAGQMIFFSDAGWTNTSQWRFERDGDFGEGAVKYTAPAGGLSAGTVMLLEFDQGAGTPGSYTFTPDPALGTYAAANDANVGTTGMLFATTGDNYFVFDGSTGSPNFIFGVKNEGGFDADATSRDTTTLPGALTVGTTALSVDAGSADNFRYTGSTSGTQAELLALIGNPANWELSSTLPFPGEDDDITNGTGGTGGGGFTVTDAGGGGDPGGGNGGITPEPSTFVLAFLGLFSLGGIAWRRRKRN